VVLADASRHRCRLQRGHRRLDEIVAKPFISLTYSGSRQIEVRLTPERWGRRNVRGARLVSALAAHWMNSQSLSSSFQPARR
jgi:hypothetical protein